MGLRVGALLLYHRASLGKLLGATREVGALDKNEWRRSILLIAVLLILAILVAQSRRNCEVPGSSWVPCVWGTPLSQK
jgi:hypothetical protein